MNDDIIIVEDNGVSWAVIGEAELEGIVAEGLDSPQACKAAARTLAEWLGEVRPKTGDFLIVIRRCQE